MPKEVELVLPESQRPKSGRVGIYNKQKYVLKVGRDFTCGLGILAEALQGYYYDQNTQPGPAQARSFQKYNRLVGFSNSSGSWQERQEFATEAAYVLKEMLSNTKMEATVEIIENYEPTPDERGEKTEPVAIPESFLSE